LGLSGPIPARVDAATKQALLDLVTGAVADGWSVAAAVSYLQLPPARYYRWHTRASAGRLDDLTPGGGAVHGLLPEEITEILAVFEQWAMVDRSHRKLAHRGSYTGRFWASPATVRRVLLLSDRHFRPLPRPARGNRRPFPDWLTYKPNEVWIYDTTHFTRSGMAVLIVQDLVSRKWLSTVCSAQETSVQVELGFTRALAAEDIQAKLAARQADLDDGVHGPHLPVLLAMSDNGPQMRSADTAEFMALASILQHFGRPGTPKDQAWIESFNGHLKAEYPHLLAITDPATLRAELDQVQVHWNTVRLHEAIGYVTPDDEHTGRGEAIRQARTEGLERARDRRLATNRATRQTEPATHPPNGA
jgi:putative transposase